ncbi:MAG TPA: hypothetical protein VJ793_01185 [Anaerolineae bacterium]|nr:hypothetical protein [Anaerolineae bacterium]
MSSEVGVVSFVLRFVVDESPGASLHSVTGWRGLIRHVQSDAERHFVHWADAVAFIEQYVKVSDDPSTQNGL